MTLSGLKKQAAIFQDGGIPEVRFLASLLSAEEVSTFETPFLMLKTKTAALHDSHQVLIKGCFQLAPQPYTDFVHRKGALPYWPQGPKQGKKVSAYRPKITVLNETE